MARKGESLLLCSLLAASAGIGQVWAGSRLDSMPPSVRWYLEQRAEKGRFMPNRDEPESLNMRMVGKWGRGPANKVTGRDSLVFMSLGSEVAIFNAADGTNPRIISEIQCRQMTGKLCLKDSFLVIGCNGPVEVYNISDPAHPTFVNRPSAAGGEIAIQDSLIFILGVDSLTIYDISDPRDFRYVGACRDSGYNLAVSDGFAYLCDRWGLYVIDARDPTRPRRVSTIAGGVEVGASWVDSGYCYYTVTYPSASFRIADVSDPYHPNEVGHRDNIGGNDIYKIRFYVYLSGFQIVDVSDRSSPQIIGSLGYGGDGVWVRSPFSFAFLAAGYRGLEAVNITDPVHPFQDTLLAGADVSQDFCCDGSYCFVANVMAGMKILDLANPQDPQQIGSYDTSSSDVQVNVVRTRGSIAYLATEQWPPVQFRVVDVSSPASPSFVGGFHLWSIGRSLEVRDSLTYVAEDNKLEIFSVANPWNPRLVGSCGLSNASTDLCLVDSLAFVGSLPSTVINIKDPSHPVAIGYMGEAEGLCVKDTFAYLAHFGQGLEVWSVANPGAPYLMATCSLPSRAHCVAISGNIAYVGECPYTATLRVFDISEPTAPAQIGYYHLPHYVWRVRCSGPYVYAACFDAGVCIMETSTTTGIAERSSGERAGDGACWISVSRNPIAQEVELQINSQAVADIDVRLTDVSGRKIAEERLPVAAGKAHLALPRDKAPPGVYFVTAKSGAARATIKIVRQ